MLELKNISKSFAETMIFKNVNLKIDAYDWVMLSGKSGSGKTTLLNIMTGFADDYEGEIYYQGILVQKQALEKLRRSDFGIVFQEKNLILEYTVYQNLLLTASLYEDADIKIDQLLTRFHLQELKNKKVNQLSGGQKQKIAIIRALLKRPQVLFLDEPTGNLDETSSLEIMKMLKEINQKITIFMITHDQELFQYANKVVFIEEHHLVEKKNISKNHSLLQQITLTKSLSLSLMLRMGFWNFKYYLKTYCLGIFIFVLACTGYIFSHEIGQSVDNDLKDILIYHNQEYELSIFSDEPTGKEEVKNLAEETNAKDYDLQLKLFSDSILFNEDIQLNESIFIKSTYELKNSQKDIVFTSSLLEKLPPLESMQFNVLSCFDTAVTNYWVEKDYQLYKPQYKLNTIMLDDYDVIESNDNVIYFSQSFIEELADKNLNENSDYSNQSIQVFKLKYTSYEALSDAKKKIDALDTYETFSIYDDFISIQKEMDNQFMIFTYSSYIMVVMIILVLSFIIFMVNKNKHFQYRIFDELGIYQREQWIIQGFEVSIFFIVAMILALLVTMGVTSFFNTIYDISSFLPLSLLDLINMYQLPIDSLHWFHIQMLDIIKSLLIITIPTLVFVMISMNIKRKNEFMEANFSFLDKCHLNDEKKIKI